MAAAGPPTTPTQPAPGTNASNLAFLQAYSQDPGIVPAGAAHKGPVSDEEISAQQNKEKPAPKDKGKGPEVPDALQPPEIPVKNVQEAVGRVPVWFSALPTIGGILFPLLLVLLFWVLIIKVNGKSRWEWLWDTLTGNAAVQTSAAKQANDAIPVIGITAGGIGAEPDPILKQAFAPPREDVTTVEASTYQPKSFSYTPSSLIAVTGSPA